MIKAVGFDLWETLITDLPEIAHRQHTARIDGVRDALLSSGLEVSRDAVEAAHTRVWQFCWDRYWSRDADVSARGQITHFLDELDTNGDVDEETVARVEAAYGGAAVKHPPILVEGAERALSLLCDIGLRVGVLSNTGRTPGVYLRRVLEMLGVSERIDAMVFSNEVGECKPRPAIFDRLRAGLGCEFEEMVFVGDNPYADVYGAQQCGMTAVHFVPASRGMAVGAATRDDYELAPHASVVRLEQLQDVIQDLLK